MGRGEWRGSTTKSIAFLLPHPAALNQIRVPDHLLRKIIDDDKLIEKITHRTIFDDLTMNSYFVQVIESMSWQ